MKKCMITALMLVATNLFAAIPIQPIAGDYGAIVRYKINTSFGYIYSTQLDVDDLKIEVTELNDNVTYLLNQYDIDHSTLGTVSTLAYANQAAITTLSGGASPDITALQQSVTVNAGNIANNTSDISDGDIVSAANSVLASGNAADIVLVAQDITDNTTSIGIVSARVTASNINITSNDSDISGINSILTPLGTTVSGNSSTLSSHSTTLTTMNTTLISHGTDISDNEGGVLDNANDIYAIDAQFTALSNRVVVVEETGGGGDATLPENYDTIANLAINSEQYSNKNQPNGYVGLNADGKIDPSLLGSIVVNYLGGEAVDVP